MIKAAESGEAIRNPPTSVLRAFDSRDATAVQLRAQLPTRSGASVELHFDHVQRGKRVACPFSYGEIHLNPAMFRTVSRGDWMVTEGKVRVPEGCLFTNRV